MNTLRDNDAVIAAWADEGPQTLPDETRQAIAVGIRTVTRAHAGFRWPGGRSMDLRRLSVALGGAAALVLVAGLALNLLANRPGIGVGPSPTSTASPTPAPSPSPAPSASSSRFTSTVHGVSIEYPSDWQVRPATEAWNLGSFTFDAPGVDVIFDPAHLDDLYLSIASAPLGDQSAEDWCCSELWAAAEVCETGGNFGRITLDGAAATIRGCDGVGNNFEDHVVQGATDTHGYVIYLHVAQDPALQAIYNEAWFDAVLETLDLP